MFWRLELDSIKTNSGVRYLSSIFFPFLSVIHSVAQHTYSLVLVMEVSSFSTTAAALPSSSSPRDVVSRVKLPLRCRQSSFSVSIASNKSITQQSLICEARRRITRSFFFKVSCSQKSEIPASEARCMDDVYDALADRLLFNAAMESNPNFKYVVGMAGPPGAGKSTVASEVVKRINKLWPHKAPSLDEQLDPLDVAIVLPMDGFHLYRHQLDAMEDPREAHARRGAPWTFDPAQLLSCLQTLRSQGFAYVPSFDHGIGDPIEDDIFVTLQHKIVIVEGNYLLLDEAVWSEISTLFDEKWFIDIDLDAAMQRVVKRHISTGKPPDVAKWRVEYNDRPNAELIMKSKKNADLVIRSIDFSN